MANESDLQLASKFFTERELDGELYADTASLEIQGEPVGVVGKYAVIAVMKRFHNSFPDFAYTVKATELTENKSVHVTLSASGTFTGNPFSPLPGIYEQVVSTGQPVSFDDGATVEIVDGKVNKVMFEAGGGLVRAYLLAGGKAREQPPSRHLLTVFEYLQHLERSKSDHISEALKVFVEGHESTPALQGRDLLFGLLYRIRASFPDFTYVVSDILEQDDAVSVDVLAMGQFKGDPFSPAPGMMPMLAPTGNVVSRKDRVVFRFEGDTVVSLTTLPTGGAVGLYDAASGLELGH